MIPQSSLIPWSIQPSQPCNPMPHTLVYRQPLFWFLSPQIPFSRFWSINDLHINGITKLVLLCVWFISPSIVFLRFIHIVFNCWVYFILDRQVHCLQFGEIVHKAAVNFWYSLSKGISLIYLGYIYLRMELLDLRAGVGLSFLRKLANTYPKWMFHFIHLHVSYSNMWEL